MPKSRSFKDFVAGLRSPATVKAYEYGINWVLDDEPDSFVVFAKKSRHKAEEQLMRFIRANKNKVASSTLANPVRAVKSFCDYAEVFLNWKVVMRELPPVNKIANDRRPFVEELRKALSIASLKMQVVILMMASGGFRVGAWKWLRLRDVEFLENGLARVTVYRDESEQYITFVSAETVAKLNQYLEARKRAGEALSPDSPIIRNDWNDRNRVGPNDVQPVTVKDIQNRLGEIWTRVGVRSPTKTKGKKRQAFQQAHGLRKFFETQIAKGIDKEMTIEALKGKRYSYFKKHPDELMDEYGKGVQYLLIDEKFSLQKQMTVQQEKHESEWMKTRLDVLELKDRNRDLEDRFSELEKLRKEHAERLGRFEDRRVTPGELENYRKRWAKVLGKGTS